MFNLGTPSSHQVDIENCHKGKLKYFVLVVFFFFLWMNVELRRAEGVGRVDR